MATASSLPPRYASPFAAVTEKTDAILRELPPAAGALWRELRRSTVPNGRHEFNLQDLAAKLNYSVRWLRAALKLLQESDLILIDRQWWKYIFSAQVLDPGMEQKPASDRQKPASDRHKTSQKQPSNPDSVVVQDPENLKETQTEPRENSVGRKTEKGDLEAAQSGTLSPLQTEALQLMDTAGIELNPKIQQAIFSVIAQLGDHALERIQTAAQVARSAPTTHRKTGQPTNREALFITALQKGWKPRTSPVIADSSAESERWPDVESRHAQTPEPVKVPDEFAEWFNLAKASGLALGSERREGELWIHTSTTAESWDYMLRMHPLAELRELATLKQINLLSVNQM